jgi:hypothetical protein
VQSAAGKFFWACSMCSDTLFSISVPTLHALARLHALMGCVSLHMFHSEQKPLAHTCLLGGSSQQEGLYMLAESTRQADTCWPRALSERFVPPCQERLARRFVPAGREHLASRSVAFCTMKKQLSLVIKQCYIALVAAPALLQSYSSGIEKG